MIVVKIELWPCGNKSLRREIARAEIANDGVMADEDGRLYELGNYEYELREKRSDVTRSKLRKRSGHVYAFPRKTLGVWDLLYRILQDGVGNRNA